MIAETSEEEIKTFTDDIILVVNSKGKMFGGVCIHLDGGSLQLIQSLKSELHMVESLVNSLKPTRIAASVAMDQVILDYLEKNTSEKNYTLDILGTKLFPKNNKGKEYLDEMIQSASSTESYSLLTELKYQSDLILARLSLLALKFIIENLESPNDEVLELKYIVQKVELFVLEDFMYIDSDSYYALNIFHGPSATNSIISGSKSCLFEIYSSFIGTSLGFKLLEKWFLQPLANRSLINRRLETVEVLVRQENAGYTADISKEIKKAGNINHIITLLKQGKMTITNWNKLLMFIETSVEVAHTLFRIRGTENSEILENCKTSFDFNALKNLSSNIRNVIDFESSKDWNRVYISDGLNEELDDLKKKYNDLEIILSEFTMEIVRNYEEFTSDIVNVVYIPQLGYLISIILNDSTLNITMPLEWKEVFRTSTNAYFKEASMESMDDSYGDLYQLIIDYEIEILYELQSSILEQEKMLIRDGDSLSMLDCFCCFASVALLNDFTKPDIVEDPILLIKNGRNPILEQSTEQYISNDSFITSNTTSIITGANASGKSCYLAQLGMIVFLAHLGSFVPASEAEIGLTDKILTRMINRESVEKCESTFFQDLQEMSKALHLKTNSSLLLVDEFGKGTDTLGGPSLLGSIIENIAMSNKCSRTILTTHFHELFQPQVLKDMSNINHYHMEIIFTKEADDSDEMVYLYQLKQGLANNSFGLRCAETCGIQDSIIKRAYDILQSENDFKNEFTDDINVERLKMITREFLLWDLEEDKSLTNQQVKLKLSEILNIQIAALEENS